MVTSGTGAYRSEKKPLCFAFDAAGVGLPVSSKATAKGKRARKPLFVFADLAGIAVGAFCACRVVASLHLPVPLVSGSAAASNAPEFIFLFTALALLFADVWALYSSAQRWTAKGEVIAVTKSVVMAGLILAASGFIANREIAWTAIGGTVAASAAAMTAWRGVRRWGIRRAAADGLTCHNLLIIGTDRVAYGVKNYLEQHRELGFVPLGLIAATPDEMGPEVLGSLKDLRSLCQSSFVDEIIICTQDRGAVKRVLQETSGCEVGIRVVPQLYDDQAYGPAIDHVGEFPLMVVCQRKVPVAELRLKRAFDIVCGVALTAFLLPIFIALAIAIKIDSRGPIFYSSRRVGRRGRVFRCHKFRTMVVNADQLKARLQHLNERDGVLFKITNDPRITRLGRHLRKYSLDELPQLFNVISGDMSLVGPRPPLVNEVNQYQLEYMRRLEVLPGITGLWQVQARANPSFEQYITLDLHYVENWSFINDLAILFRTIGVVFAGTGQ